MALSASESSAARAEEANEDLEMIRNGKELMFADGGRERAGEKQKNGGKEKAVKGGTSPRSGKYPTHWPYAGEC